MSVRSLVPVLALLVAAPLVVPPAPAIAQETAPNTDAKFSNEELDQILAPIALYPDDLLSNVLMASTYPLEVVEAARWIEDPANADLKGDALTQALEDKDWDPSVKALTQFPEVLAMMSEQLEWMQKLGDAFIASEADVMDRVQFLREKAEEAGHLKSNEHQTITTREEDGDDYIYIEPAEPDVVYVPVYDPLDVYGTWWYPDYPPYYWELDNVVYVNGFFWGAGVVTVPSLWAWSRPRWHDHYIYISPRKYNRLRKRGRTVSSERWRHDAYHRRGAKFKGAKAWRKSWDPKRNVRRMRILRRDREGTRVLKLQGGAQQRGVIGKTPRILRPGHLPPTFKAKPHTRTFSAPKTGGAIPKVIRRLPNRGHISGGGKKLRASPVKKHRSGATKRSGKKKKAVPRSRKRFSAHPRGHHARKVHRARRLQRGHAVHRAMRSVKAHRGGHKGGKKKGKGKLRH